jgi:hypothetical protein
MTTGRWGCEHLGDFDSHQHGECPECVWIPERKTASEGWRKVAALWSTRIGITRSTTLWRRSQDTPHALQPLELDEAMAVFGELVGEISARLHQEAGPRLVHSDELLAALTKKIGEGVKHGS